MYKLTANIKIGAVQINSVHEVSIDHSVYNLSSICIIKVPASAVLRSAVSVSNIETVKQFKVGEAVRVELGYNDALKLEFEGYVKMINVGNPVEVVCENYAYKLRSKTIIVSGKQSVASIVAMMGAQIGRVDDINIGNFVANQESAIKVLNRLRNDYGLLAYFDTLNKLYVVTPESIKGERVKYSLRRNVISDKSLKTKSQDEQITISAVSYNSDGTIIETSVGAEGGSQRKITYAGVASVAELQKIAQNELTRLNAEGYEGSIEAFLVPHVKIGDIASISDEVFETKSGNYKVSAVKTKFGINGAKRTLEIGVKL